MTELAILKNLKCGLAFIVMAVCAGFFLLCLTPCISHAANAAVNKTLVSDLNTSASYTEKTFSSFDITGDGINDKVEIEIWAWDEDGWYGPREVDIYINDQFAYAHEGFLDYMKIKYMRLSNGKSFIHIDAPNGIWYSESILLSYQDSRLKTALPNKDKVIYKRFNSCVNSIKATGNMLTMTYGIKIYGAAPNYGFKTFVLKCNYRLKGGKLKAVNTYCGTFRNARFAMKKTARLYSSPSSKKLKAIVQKKTKVRVSKVRVRNGSLYFRVKTDKGRYGWVSASNVKTSQVYI